MATCGKEVTITVNGLHTLATEFEIDWYTAGRPQAEKIIKNGNVMIVIWSDGKKTRATCAEGDKFDPAVGFAICLAKRLYNKRERARIVRKVKVQA